MFDSEKVATATRRSLIFSVETLQLLQWQACTGTLHMGTCVTEFVRMQLHMCVFRQGN